MKSMFAIGLTFTILLGLFNSMYVDVRILVILNSSARSFCPIFSCALRAQLRRARGGEAAFRAAGTAAGHLASRTARR